MAKSDLSSVVPRVLIVSRRTVRKNKFVDFVGECHFDLIVSYGAVPVIVPRVSGLHKLLESFEPIHGVLLCEGEDIDPSLDDAELSGFSPEELEEIRKLQEWNGCCVQEFVKSVIAYSTKLNRSESVPKAPQMNQESEAKRKTIVRSFSITKGMFSSGGMFSDKESEIEVGAEFVEAIMALSLQQENRLKQMDATMPMRSASVYKKRTRMNEERERFARTIMNKMTIGHLSDLMSFYHMIANMCSEVLERKIQDRVDEVEVDF